MANYWLLKSEPSVYSIDQLKKDRKTNWDLVRNYQARNVLRDCKKGDMALIYHSNDERAVVGIAEVVREAYPDPDPEQKGDWVQIDVKFLMKLRSSVPLSTLKSHPKLKTLPLIKQSRLSCMPIHPDEFQTILSLGESWEDFLKQK
jgi:predicted RNA-binding protein with PUA-like domain